MSDPGGLLRRDVDSGRDQRSRLQRRVHRHLRRLDRIWVNQPIYFVTTCTQRRRDILATAPVAEILIDEWSSARQRHGWAIGRYVIMGDHVHFFCSAEIDAKPLAEFMRSWKQWTSKRIARGGGIDAPVWQQQFFDHVLRSVESYREKWEYVHSNPVRAGLVANPDEWPFAGEIEDLLL